LKNRSTFHFFAPFASFARKKVSRKGASVFSPGRKDFFIKKLSFFAPSASFARKKVSRKGASVFSPGRKAEKFNKISFPLRPLRPLREIFYFR